VGCPEVLTEPAGRAYWVFDAMASCRANPNLDLRLNVDNLADERYVASINKSGYRYTPARRVRPA
jgi:catecholate siderophore receptor